LQDVSESEYMNQYVRDPKQEKGGKGSKEKKTNGFVVKGAPWEAPPDTQVGTHSRIGQVAVGMDISTSCFLVQFK
jgi:hypothetical protein